MPAPAPRVIVIGAGVGGLAAALDLARQGCQVQVLRPAGIAPSLYPPGVHWLSSLADVPLA